VLVVRELGNHEEAGLYLIDILKNKTCLLPENMTLDSYIEQYHQALLFGEDW
jgi:hypothetical protein